ncbi:IucA/IucC family C-terminal-domain containing protein [Glycomyces tenuis]|uniref:IucA/IucC family C-terminal-domain containing protein n=1 Tax=Glycomyces tenuis TaxID=58116 RepID=UPI0003F98E3B|nr:IucA/IucC family C-terminal-domain containing protein [Glycomyces tenuis]
MLSAAAVDLQRSDVREFVPQHPSFPKLAAPLRTAADHVERRCGPHPLRGLRPWLDGTAAPEGVDLPGSALADGSRIGELLADSARLWGGSPHASAALAWKTYCYWVLVPAVLGYVSARRVPLLEADNFVFTISEDEPMFSGRQIRPRFTALSDDPMAGTPGVETVAGEDALLERMRASLFDEHLDPVLEAIRREVRIGRRTLLGSLASGIAYATANCSSAGREPAEVVAKNLLETFGVAELVDVATDEHGRLVYQRHTCCLAFTIDGCGTCSTCCVQTEHR